MRKHGGVFARTMIAFGLLIAVVAAGQWVRAQFVHEWFRWMRADPTRATDNTPPRVPADIRVLEANGGGLAFVRFDAYTDAESDFGFDRLHAAPARVNWTEHQPPASRLGFGFNAAQSDRTIVAIPYWAIIVGGVTPLLMHRLLLRRRLQRGRDRMRCHVCNYDLRATPDRCPECGTARTLAMP